MKPSTRAQAEGSGSYEQRKNGGENRIWDFLLKNVNILTKKFLFKFSHPFTPGKLQFLSGPFLSGKRGADSLQLSGIIC